MEPLSKSLNDAWWKYQANPEHYDNEFMERYANELWMPNYQSLDSYGRSIYRLVNNRSIAEVFTHETWGDLCLGFHSKYHEDCTITVSVRPLISEWVNVRQVSLRCGEFESALQDGGILPIIATQHTDIRFDVHPKKASVDVIYAFVDTVTRQSLATLPIHHGKECFSMGIYSHSRPSASSIALPTIQVISELKKQCFQRIERELIEATWHPKRLAWCLDIDDAHFIRPRYTKRWHCCIC